MLTAMIEVSDGPDRRTMGRAGAALARGETHSGPQAGTSIEESPRSAQWGLAVLHTGARWRDLPKGYLPYQTCHRRFQRWVRTGVMEAILRALAEDLKVRAKLDLQESFLDSLAASFSCSDTL
ncbi:MAG: transposase [Candidatus Methanomethyliaceae archaeon]